MFCAQICDNLRDFRVSERVGKRRHLLATVENLVRDLFRSPELVLANVDKRRSFLASDAAHAVAVSTTLVAKEDRTGLLGGLILRSSECNCGKKNN